LDSSLVYVTATNTSGNQSQGSDTIKVAYRSAVVAPPATIYDDPYASDLAWTGWLTDKKSAVRPQTSPSLYGTGVYYWYVPSNQYLNVLHTLDRKFNLPAGRLTGKITARAETAPATVALQSLSGGEISVCRVMIGTKVGDVPFALDVVSGGTYWVSIKSESSLFVSMYTHQGMAPVISPNRVSGLGAILK
jgi:hypothetical protein